MPTTVVYADEAASALAASRSSEYTVLDLQKDVVCGSLAGSQGMTYCAKDVLDKAVAFARHKSLDRWFSRSKLTEKRIVVPEGILHEALEYVKPLHDAVRECPDTQLWIFCRGARDAAAVKATLKNCDVSFVESGVSTSSSSVASSLSEAPQTINDVKDLCALMVSEEHRARFQTNIFHDDDVMFMLYETQPRLSKTYAPDMHDRINGLFIDASVLSSATEINHAQGSLVVDAAYEIKQRAMLACIPPVPLASLGRDTWDRSVALALTSQRSSLSKSIPRTAFGWYQRMRVAERNADHPGKDTYDNLYAKLRGRGGKGRAARPHGRPRKQVVSG